MKITLTGSLGNITKPLAQQLINSGHAVTIISSNQDKVAAITALGATPAIGVLTDIDFVTGAFKGADAVYAMVPPNLVADDFRGYANQIGQSYAAAIKASGVKRIVFLSSVGAHLDAGIGPIIGSHDVEGILGALGEVSVTYLRASFFYTNFLGNIPMIKNVGIMGSNYPVDARVIFVSPKDIAAAAAEELQQPSTGKKVRYVYSDEKTIGQAAAILGAAIGKADLPWVEFTDEQTVQGMQQAGFSADMANKFVEMGTAVRNGILWTDFDKHQPQPGNINLEEFAQEFAKAYRAS